MKITDAAHAVRVLKALVEHLENVPTLDGQHELVWVWHGALLEGAKAVLARVPDQKVVAPEIWSKASEEGTLLAFVILDLARAYAPRMLEAGMTVPE